MKSPPDSKTKIAVIGSGISGIYTAYLLMHHYDVTLYEKNDYFGGHTHTVPIPDGPDQGIPVDTGFIVLNKKNYPHFIRFLNQLGVGIKKTDMSFSYHCVKTGLCYASKGLNSIFAQRSNIFKPAYLRFVYEIIYFLKKIRKDYLENRLEDITLGDYFGKIGLHQEVVDQFIIPMAAAIWSGSDLSMKDFPVKTYAQFYENHGLLAVKDHPPWYFVENGSHTYVKAFLKQFHGQAHTLSNVVGVKRENEKILIRFEDNEQKTFDRVVIATHADQALKLLEDPSDEEQALLKSWQYSKNMTCLHTDKSFMPPNQRAWASWNYSRETDAKGDDPITLTYDMTRLQRLGTERSYLVTLNPKRPIPGDHIIREIRYEHPQYSFDALSTQKKLDHLNGKKHTYFCGSYFGYGFHEDGVKSAISVAKKLGVDV